jgi:sulfite exporter TauE/SafE
MCSNLIAVLLLLLFGLLLLARALFPRFPSNAELDEFFLKRKEAFVVLRHMLESEAAEVIGITQQDVMLNHT